LELFRTKRGTDRGQTVLQAHIGVNISSANNDFHVSVTFCSPYSGFQGKFPDLIGKGFMSAVHVDIP